MSESKAVSQEAARFLEDHRINKVWFANKKDTPLPDAQKMNFSCLCLVLSGQYEVELSVSGKQTVVTIAPGEALFTPPLCWNVPTWKTPCKTINFLFSPTQTGLSINICQSGNQLAPPSKGSIPGSLKNEGRLIESALNEIAFTNPSNPAAPCIAEALIKHCCHLDSLNIESISRIQSRWEHICIYLQENYGPDITRESVARTFAMTPNHLSKLFKQGGKLGFNSYLTFVRITQVKHLLSNHPLNLDEISERTGFRSGDYLGRVFRKSTGLTPGEYRAKYINKKTLQPLINH